MLQEFVRTISEQAVKAAGIRVLTIGQEPNHHYLIDKGNGEYEWQTASAEPRAHRPLTLTAFTDYVRRAAEQSDSVPIAVWYSRHQIMALLDDHTRRDCLTFALSPSPQLETLSGLASSPRWLGQAEFIRLLRITLAGCLGPAGNLLALIRQVKFRVNSAGASEVQHQRTSLGKTLEAEMTGVGELPEEMPLDVPVFAQAGLVLVERVQCALEVDPQTAKFQLTPLPGELEQAQGRAEASIGRLLADALEGTEVAVYCGQP